MATQRYISTSFWDDGWVQELTPHERYLYLYLLTNPLTNIAGAYKITDKRIMFDTGLTQAQLKDIMRGFTESRKAVRHGEWIILPAWPDHQKWDSSPKVKKGIEALLRTFSPDILGVMVQVGYRYPIDTLSIPYIYPTNYLDSDSDSDSDLYPPTPPTQPEPDKKPPRTPACPHAEMQSYWNTLVDQSGLRRCESWPTKEALAIWKQDWFRKHWGYIFQECHESGWCKEAHAGPDHVLRLKNARKYYELVLPKLRKEGIVQ